MADSFRKRLSNAWNVFRNRDPTNVYDLYKEDRNYSWWDWNHDRGYGLGLGSGTRPDRPRLTMGNERSIIASIYNRIAVDVAAIRINHVRLGDNNHFKAIIESSLNEVLTLQANIDQTARAFMQDVVLSLFDEGCIAIVPTIVDEDPEKTESYHILSVRTGKIIEWYPYHVLVRLYNELTGRHEDKVLEKSFVAIIENPLYAVMNERNSTLARLIRTLNLLDVMDDKVASGKLDIIIQLPYEIKTPNKKSQAEIRRKDIEAQLTGSSYGIAYMGATERITQLNRPAENNLMNQAKDLQAMLYGQLGLTEAVMMGEADEKTMLNYYTRTLEPILSAIVVEMKRKFLTRTAITQKQSIEFFRDPFRLVPVADLAEAADKLTRNEILTSNEFRGIMGYEPVEDPRADELRNKNITAKHDQLPEQVNTNGEGEIQNGI